MHQPEHDLEPALRLHHQQTDGDDQTGGYNDFTAHMVSTGLQIRF